MRRINKRTIIFGIISILSLAGYILISYFTPRHLSLQLLSLYFFLFAGYILFIRMADTPGLIRTAYGLGILFRLSLILLIPNLSDDIYRFLWDGHLVAEGINPFIRKPLFFLNETTQSIPGIDQDLFNKFGKNTYSSYPPLNQWIFAFSVWIFPDNIVGSVIIIRACIILFELGNIFLIRRMLQQQSMPDQLGLLYVLNPLIILELTGNLHFEALMIFFLLLSFYLLASYRWIPGALSMTFAILSKLIPLVYLPLLWKKLGLKKGFFSVSITGIFVVFAFIPFITGEMILGFTDSLGLYFQKFEFNASIYYLIRQIGYWIVDYNIIQTAGPLLGLFTLGSILLFSFTPYTRKAPIIQSAMWILMIYLAMTTTLHPWYITTLIPLSTFTPYRFPIVWSLMIILTYEGYTTEGYQVNYWLIALEYVTVYGWLIWEIIKEPPAAQPAGSGQLTDGNTFKCSHSKSFLNLVQVIPDR